MNFSSYNALIINILGKEYEALSMLDDCSLRFRAHKLPL